MSLRVSQEASGVVLEFSDSLDIAGVAEIHRQLLEAVDAPAITIDLGGVTALDSAGVQLLLSLVKYCDASQRSVSVKACSEAARNAMGLLNVQGLFDCSPTEIA